MDFSVIRSKRPAKTPTPSPAPQPSGGPPTAGPPMPPPSLDKPPQPNRGPSRPFMVPNWEELDNLGRMHHIRSIEYSNSKTWRMNFRDHYSNDYHDNNPYYNNGYNNYSQPQYNHNGPFQRMSIPPPPEYRQRAIPGPPSRHALPPPQYHYGPPPPRMLGLPPPQDYHYPPPRDMYYGGGYFYDDNPNGCMIM